MRVRIDLPVFASPVSAFGYATGIVDLESLPEPQKPFPWPAAWVEAKPGYFTNEQGLVWGVGRVGPEILVTMYGIVCKSPTEARECARFLQDIAGLEFNEHESSGQGRDA